MEPYQKELLVARIIAGCLRFKVWHNNQELTLVFKKPTPEQIYLAQELYHEYKLALEMQGCMDEKEMIDFLMTKGIWTVEKQAELDRIIKDMEEFKVKLYELTFKANEKKVVKKALKVAKDRHSKLLEEKNSFAYATTTGAASVIRSRYIIAMSTFLPNGQPLFTDETYWADDTHICELLSSAYFQSRLSETEYRELSRDEPWRSIWNSKKAEGAVFGTPAIELNEEQRTLVIWSGIYDSIFEHSECPPDSVISDDDVLDGWMIIQKRKRTKDIDKSRAEQLVSNEKIRNSGEVYIPAEGKEAIAAIDNLNDTHAQMIKRQRLQFARKKGVVHEAEMPDSQLQIRTELNEKFMASAKGKG